MLCDCGASVGKYPEIYAALTRHRVRHNRDGIVMYDMWAVLLGPPGLYRPTLKQHGYAVDAPDVPARGVKQGCAMWRWRLQLRRDDSAGVEDWIFLFHLIFSSARWRF